MAEWQHIIHPSLRVSLYLTSSHWDYIKFPEHFLNILHRICFILHYTISIKLYNLYFKIKSNKHTRCILVHSQTAVYQHNLTLFTHLSMKFFFLLICVAVSKGVERWAEAFSSASNMPSQLRHLRESFSVAMQSSSLLSGKLCKDFSGECDSGEALASWSQLSVGVRESFSNEDSRRRRGLKKIV